MRTNWKHWPYWVRGGILTLVVASMVVAFSHDLSLAKQLLLLPVMMLTRGIYLFVYLFLSTLDFNIDTLAYPIFIILYGGIGALLGYLYGKFKNRKAIPLS